MAYDFDSFFYKSETGRKTTSLKDVFVLKEDDVEKRVLLGEDITKNSIPVIEHAIVNFPASSGHSFGMSEEILSKHLLLVGGIGCGKTNTFQYLIQQTMGQMTVNDVMLVFDTKGDFKDTFYRGYSNQILIENGYREKEDTGYWNIFKELLMPDGTYEKSVCDIAAKEMAKQLFKGRESSSQPFFTDAAADILAKIFIFFMRHAKKENLNNEKLVEWLKKATIENYLQVMNQELDFKSALMYFGDGKSPQALGVFGVLNSLVEDLFVGVFAKKADYSHKEFSMRKMVREKAATVVFVEYDLSSGEVLGPIYRVLFDLALKEALGRSEKSRGNVYFMIDEFKLLPDLLHIDDGLNFGRSLGVKICAGVQSISQLKQVYGSDRARVIVAGFMNLFAFQVWDKESRDFIKEYFGQNYVNLSFYDEKEVLQSISKEGNAVEDWDIMNLQRGEAYITLNGFRPFKFRFDKFI